MGTITRISQYYFLILFMTLLMIGCSSGGQNAIPTLPGQNPDTSGEQIPGLTGNVSESDNHQGAVSGHGLLGYFYIYVDTETGEAEMIPARDVELHLNIINYLEKNPCTDCFKIVGITFSPQGNLLIDILLKHPFPMDIFTVFDVRGILMFPGSQIFPLAGDGGMKAPNRENGDGILVNAEGYTSLYNPKTIGLGPGGLQGYFKGGMATLVFPDCEINGYLRYISDDPINTRNALFASDEVTRTFELALPYGQFVLGYAIDANWELPTENPPEDLMNDFPPGASCPEPWKVEVVEEPIGSGLTTSGGATKLVADIYDWQGMESFYTPQIENPDLFEGKIEMQFVSEEVGFSTWEVTFSNDLHAIEGLYPVLVSIEDKDNDFPVNVIDLTAYQIVTVEVVQGGGECEAKAAFEPEDPIVCEEVHFYDDGSVCYPETALVKWEWDFDDDGYYEVLGDEAWHTFNLPDEYPVNYRVTNFNLATDTVMLTVVVGEELPTAYAETDVDESVPAGEPVTFDGSGSFDNDCDGAEIVQWEWDWTNDGDFEYSTENPVSSHTYPSEGIFEVQLRVTDDEGSTDVLDEPLHIPVGDYQDPIAQATVDSNIRMVCEPAHFMDDGSYDPDGGIITKYEWDWDGDGVFDEEGVDVNHAWEIEGTFYVQFRVTDEEFQTDELDEPFEIVVANAPPTAIAFADTYSVYTGDLVQFDGTDSYDSDTCGDVEIAEWEWDFDYHEPVFDIDAAGSQPEHIFTTEGTYLVMLRVTDTETGTDLLDEPLIIVVTKKPEDPVPLYVVDPNPQTVCEPLHFQDDGSYDPDGGLVIDWEWDWNNDGNYDESGPDVYHAWDIPGAYYVGYRVTDEEGATGETDFQVFIENAAPTAIATADNLFPLKDEVVNFSGSESHDNDCGGQFITSWEWDWTSDDTWDDTGVEASHAYTDYGTYSVRLRVMDNEGEADITDLPEIKVTSLPVAVADADPKSANVCAGIHFFDNGSYDPDGGAIGLGEWDFNEDGIPDAEGYEIYYAFDTIGTHLVQYRVTDDEGQTDILDIPLTINIDHELPFALADVGKDYAMANEGITFDASESTDNDCDGEEIVAWDWDWENNGSYDSQGEIISHSWDTPGIYEVQLRVTDDEGGTDVLNNPFVITVSPEGCQPDEINNWDDPDVPLIQFGSNSGIRTVCNYADREDWYRFHGYSALSGSLNFEVISANGPVEFTLYNEAQAQNYPSGGHSGQVTAFTPTYLAEIPLGGLGEDEYYVRISYVGSDFLVKSYRFTNNGDYLHLGPTYIIQDINNYTEWRPQFNPYVIEDKDIRILGPDGYLKIYPGVVVKLGSCFNEYYGIEVRGGILRCLGEPGNEIIFTSIRDEFDGFDLCNDTDVIPPAPGDWTSVRSHWDYPESVMEITYTNFRYGGAVDGMLYPKTKWFSATNCLLEYSGNIGLIHNPNPADLGYSYITTCIIRNNNGHGIRCKENSGLHINNCEVYDNGGAVISFNPYSPAQWYPNNSHWGNGYEARCLEGDVGPYNNFTLTVNEQSILPYVAGTINAQNADFNVEPGVVVKIMPDAIIKSRFNCLGLPENKIIFTSVYDDEADGIDVTNDGPTTPNSGDWGYLYMDYYSSVFSYCEFRYGGGIELNGYFSMINARRINPAVDFQHCKFEYAPVGLQFYKYTYLPSIFTLNNCDIGYCGIGLLSSSDVFPCGTIENSNVYNNDVGFNIPHCTEFSNITFTGNGTDIIFND